MIPNKILFSFYIFLLVPQAAVLTLGMRGVIPPLLHTSYVMTGTDVPFLWYVLVKCNFHKIPSLMRVLSQVNPIRVQ
jgi:hypothetical protein